MHYNRCNCYFFIKGCLILKEIKILENKENSFKKI